MTANTVLALCAGGLLLGLIAVVIDRLNFPQRRFVPKKVITYGKGPHRDRVGAHIVEVYEDEEL